MIELDSVSEKILKQIIKYDNCICPEDFKKIKCLRKYSNDEISECLDNLESLHFIILNETQDRITVSFKGKQYFLLNNKKWLERIIISFVFPILVSFITTKITLLLSN